MLQQIKNQKGSFAVILIIVIVLVAIGALIVVVFDPITKYNQSLDSKRKTDLVAIQQALNTYYTTYNHYPGSPGIDPFPAGQTCERGTVPDYRIVDITATPVEWGTSWKFYMPEFPKDPQFPDKTYVYFVSCDGQSYWLYASLITGVTDKAACNGGKACTSFGLPGFPSPTSCGKDGKSVCNYGVSSSNVSL